MQRELVFVSPNKIGVRRYSMGLGRSPYSIIIQTKHSLISAGTELALLSGYGFAIQGKGYPYSPSATVVGKIVFIGPAAAQVRPDLSIGVRVVAKARHAAFWELNVLRDEICLLGSNTSDEMALLARLMNVAAYATTLADNGHGNSALVLGLGLVGQLILRCAAKINHSTIQAIDSHVNRLDAAARIDGVVVGKLNNKMAAVDTVFIACSSNEAIEIGLSNASDCGTVVLIGGGIGPVSIDLARHVFRRGVRLLGAHERFANNNKPFPGAGLQAGLDLLGHEPANYGNLITNYIDAVELEAVYGDKLQDKGSYVGLAVDWMRD